MGGNNRKKLNKAKSRKPGASSANRGLFVEGGLLSDWSPFDSPPSKGDKGGNKNSRPNNGKGSSSDSKPGPGSGMGSRSSKNRGNAIRYVYPEESAFVDGGENQESNMDGSNPIVLIDSEKTPIIAYLDEGPIKKSQNVDYIYDNTSSFTLEESSHRGLGFYDEAEATPYGIGSSSKFEEKENGLTYMSSSEADEMDCDVCFVENEVSEEIKGYVLIGGTKIYTRDISDEDDDGDEEEEQMSDEESSSSSVSVEGSETSESDDSSSSNSDIDDDVAADYFEGIGGIKNVVNVNQLVGQSSDSSNDVSDSENIVHETLQKLGGMSVQDASMEYGLKNPETGRKYRAKNKKSVNVNYAWSSSFDDLMFVKDPRSVSGRKKHVSKLPPSLPSEYRKSKRFRRIPGEKKKHRKETIAVKRRDRMLRRGVDLQKINLELQQIVLDGVDMFSFQPMHSRDCSQVRRLAAIYRLQSGCQGSGKKRCVTVMQTQHTSMPSASDTIRLKKLIGPDENADFSITDGKPVKVYTKLTPIGSKSLKEKSNRNSANHPSKEEKKNKRSGHVGSYAAQPPSFVASGVLDAEIVEVKTVISNEINDASHESKPVPNSVEQGAFEMHTTGFGSKMLAKMGYVQGSGLGKEGQGMSQPIEVSQRPKSLGLGADVIKTSAKSTNIEPRAKSMRRDANSSGTKGKLARKEVPKLGSFEKHTKGFGSKIMAKMGFVEGSGLGRDCQGMVDPLVAVRRPKARGLGATR